MKYRFLALTYRVSNSVDSERGPKMCISNIFAANAGAAGLGTTLLEPPIQVKRLQSTGRASSDQ